MSRSAIIRSAEATDAATIADLLAQLGYPAIREEVQARLVHLDQFRDAVALVADVQGRVVGLVTGHVFPSIHTNLPVAWVTTLVVGDRHLRTGIGTQLTAAVEEWAREHGASRISVTSGKHRDGAHAFYERVGYERTGVRLTKLLP